MKNAIGVLALILIVFLSAAAFKERISVTPRASSPEKISSTTVPCDGDGVSGNRVQILYVRASDIPNHYLPEWINSYRSWTKEGNDFIIASAAKTGGYRSIRFVHDSNCVPSVENVVIDINEDDSFENLKQALASRGYDKVTRKYLIFADNRANNCGESTGELQNDTKSSNNPNNFGPDYATVNKKCWLDTNPIPFTDQAAHTVAHEVMHTMGAVQFSAPHSDQVYHCNDDYDLMCTSSHIPDPSTFPCTNPASWFELDCNNDDYFHTNPESESYLATHWNSADNQFLMQAPPTPPNGNKLTIKVKNGQTGQKYPSSLTMRATYMSDCPTGCNYSSCQNPVCTLGREQTYSPNGCNDTGCATWENSTETASYQIVPKNLPENFEVSDFGCGGNGQSWTPTPENDRTCTIKIKEKVSQTISGFIFKDVNQNALKNPEASEKSISNISIALFKVEGGSSTKVAETKSNSSSDNKNFQFPSQVAGKYQFGRPKLPPNLTFLSCDQVVLPKRANIPHGNHFFYCQGPNETGKKNKLFIKKWAKDRQEGFIDVTPKFSLEPEKNTTVDIPLVNL